jgi:hypothetical protein
MIKISNALVIDATEKLGIGTSQEFLIAKYYKKPTIVISPNGSHYNKTIRTEKSDNFHYIHPFLKSTSDIIVDSHEEAVMVLLGHFSGKKTILPKTIKMIESARQDYAKNFMHLDKYMADFTKSKNGYL